MTNPAPLCDCLKCRVQDFVLREAGLEPDHNGFLRPVENVGHALISIAPLLGYLLSGLKHGDVEAYWLHVLDSRAISMEPMARTWPDTQGRC